MYRVHLDRRTQDIYYRRAEKAKEFFFFVLGHCKEFGIDYEHGEEIYSKRLEIPDYCSGLFCLNSKIVYVPKYQCGRKDKIPLATSVDFDPIQTTMSLKKRMTLQPFIPFTPTLLGCLYGGQLYKPGERVQEMMTINGCFSSLICDGNERLRTDWQPGCPRTTQPPPTPIHRCYYNGKYYGPGEILYSGHDGNWCYSARCMLSGKVQYGDNFNCFTTVEMTPTASMAPPVIHVG